MNEVGPSLDLRVCYGEIGRSMVEMLGTLALIGVLSVVGLMGYSYLMDGIKANSILNEVNKRAHTCVTQFGFMDREECDLSEYSEQIDGKYTTSPLNMNNGYFGIQVSDVPKSICQQVLNKGFHAASQILPETCAELNEMKFVFENTLSAVNKCTENSDCKTVCGICTDGVCVGECPTEQSECTQDSECPGVCVACVKESGAQEGLCKACEPVEYLESTGTQYIDIGLVPTANTNFELDADILLTSRPSAYQCIYGYWGGNTNGRFAIFATPNTAPNGYMQFVFGTNANFVNFGSSFGRGIYKLQDGVFSYNGQELLTVTGSPVTSSATNMYMFGTNDTSSRDFAPQKVYMNKVWESTQLVRDFIPVLDPRGIPAMYDKENNVLYYNIGTSNFKTNKN